MEIIKDLNPGIGKYKFITGIVVNLQHLKMNSNGLLGNIMRQPRV